MKRFLIALAAAVNCLALPAQAADVGISVSIGQPGFYGRLDIGGFPAPALLFPQPMIIHRGPPAGPPLYLRVPPGHARSWAKYCHRYDACGVPVYFVRDDWYQREYVPRYRERHSYPDYDRHDDRQDRREDRRDYRNDRRDDRHDYRGEQRDDRYERRDERRDERHERRDERHDNGHR